MKNNKSLTSLLMAGLSSLMLVQSAHAVSIDWSGHYRFEYVDVSSTSLDSPVLGKSYMLNQLSLSPKIIAADGVNIVGKFEILPNDQYPNSQVGQNFGRGPSKAGTRSSSKDDSSVAGNKQGNSNLQVSQLYLNVNQEYGSLVVGRAPVEFGLGISHSAGNGPFDHWNESHDMVGYKMIIGNFSFMPIFGKPYDYSVSHGREASEVILIADYNNPETQSQFAILHQTKKASKEANDAPATALGGSGATVTDRWNTQHVSLFLARGFEEVKFRIEAGFESGDTGIYTPSGDQTKLAGYGIALEVEFPRVESKLHWTLRTGVASGDRPDSSNYEGFHFNRNYDVAFLLFNHPLGRYDLLRSYAQRSPDRLNCSTGTCSPYATDEALDDETISNAIYVSPKFVYNINDRWDWVNTITWAQLQTDPLATAGGASVDKDLGFEWDTGFAFKPHEKIMWINEIGMLFPGNAWSAGSRKYGNDFTYGFVSKAAISF